MVTAERKFIRPAVRVMITNFMIAVHFWLM
jgi:hypothetical protein